MAVTAVSPGNTNFRVNGDSSPSPSPSPLSAESSFRELDDAFFQTQTRIWLGEVLQIRFDEETNISDILADGELLFEVAEVLSRVLPAPAAEASHIRANESKSLVSSKSTRRYMPYYNVGTFLRMCKNLGLNGIDLFSPSDVVEKRDSRKVCMCIRSLSKKVRSREINVPDFDSVVCTLAMPTDRVKGIRKSLEQSQCSSSFSTGPELRRVRYWKRMSNSDSMASNGHFSNNCDEAESEHIAVESNQPSDYPGSELMRDDNSLPELQLNTGELENGENVQCEYLSPSVPESVGSPSSVYFSDQEMSTISSSTFQASHICGMNCNMQNDRQKGDINPVPFDWGDILSHDYVLPHDGDNSDTASCGSCPVTRENKTYYAGIENLSCPSDIGCELSSCDSLERTHWNNFVSNRERVLDVSDECFDETSPCPMNENVDGDDIGPKIHPCELIRITHHVSGHADNLVPQSSNEATNAINEAFDVKSLTLDPKEECNDGDSMGVDARHPMDLPEMNMNSSNTIINKDNKKWSDESSQNTLEVFEDHNIEGQNVDDKPVDVEDIFSVNSSSTTLYSPEPEAGRGENVEGTGHKHHQFADNMEKDASDTKGIDQETPQSKPHMTLLKTVAKSTAVVGVAVFLLHLRWKNTKAHIPKVKKEPIQVPKKSTTKFPAQKTEKVRNSSSVYPSQNLHLGI